MYHLLKEEIPESLSDGFFDFDKNLLSLEVSIGKPLLYVKEILTTKFFDKNLLSLEVSIGKFDKNMLSLEVSIGKPLLYVKEILTTKCRVLL
jgi:hypothetical protein